MRNRKFCQTLFLILILVIGCSISAEAANSIAKLRAIEDTTFVIPEVDLKSLNTAPRFSNEIIHKRLDSLTKQIPLDYNSYVQGYIDLYAFRRREQVERMLGLSEFYFPMVERVFKEYNIPDEFKYLAIVESALNPYAVSPVGATGMWQFMFTTGKMYGLKITSHIDERRDPLLATQAAAQYFVDMYKRYGDWLLVIAAYNCGPGNVNKAIRKAGGQKNFWAIRKYLPQETRGYVPAYIAATYIMNCAEVHAIYPSYPNFSFLNDTIYFHKPVAFKDIEQLCGVQGDEIRILNPIFKKDFVPAYQEPFMLKLPATRKDLVATFRDSLYKLFPQDKQEEIFVLNTDPSARAKTVYKTHVVKKGESLGKISNKYNVSVTDIKKWNGLKKSTLYAGQRLKIKQKITPPATATAKTIKKAPAPIDRTDVAASSTPLEDGNYKEIVEYKTVTTTKNHKVKKGESLGALANKYDVSVSELKKWNNLKGSQIMVGQTLKIKTESTQKVTRRIPVKKEMESLEQKQEVLASAGGNPVEVSTEQPIESAVVFHKVEKGDTLWSIAKQYDGMTVEKLREINGLKETDPIKTGMLIKIIKKV
jgi:membrane-bound lytic murein transglycosylase D